LVGLAAVAHEVQIQPGLKGGVGVEGVDRRVRDEVHHHSCVMCEDTEDSRATRNVLEWKPKMSFRTGQWVEMIWTFLPPRVNV
jgi:hypothetical protein